MMRFFIPAVPLKVKLVGKYVFKNTSKQAFITNFQFSLRPKNEFGALLLLNYIRRQILLKMEGVTYQQA